MRPPKLIFSMTSILAFSISASAASLQPELTAFLSSFPNKMICTGVEVNFITGTRTVMPERLLIEMTGKNSDSPMIEVIAPSASSKRQFRIGNGYGAKLEQGGQYAYYFVPSKKVFYYLRVINENDPVNDLTVLRARDMGTLISFSESRVCPTTHTCFEFSNCTTDQ